MKLIQVMSMCGGHDKAFEVTIKGITVIFFCTSEGISRHHSKTHLMNCIEGDGFVGYLNIKANAIPTAKHLLKFELSENNKAYIQNLINEWEK